MTANAFTDAEVPDTHGYTALGHQQNPKGWELTTFRAPYYDLILEFVQIDHPTGESSYFRLDVDGEFVAGPFGGGYSWAVPKYVVAAGERLARETFAPVSEEVPA